MAERYRVFASHLLFKEVADDALGHLYRAGELDRAGVRRTVWLRIFDGPLATGMDLGSGFDRARKIGEIVQSSNVARGVNCLLADGVAALAHEYVASQPLSLVFDRVAEERFPIPVDNALLIVEKIALALAAALAVEIDGARVAHGFLQPALIYVTYDGECVVSGFGLGEELLAVTGDGGGAADVCPYIAPEVLVSRTPSRQGDVYALGAVLFQLLTGAPLPAEPDKRREAIDAATMAHEDEAIPDDIRALLTKSLGDRPKDRFSSAADFKKELDRLLYGGAYSPTTFNLALFMDRLFRSETEDDERDRAKEQAVDATLYLAPPVEPPPEPVLEFDDEAAHPDRRRLYLGLGAATAVIAVAAILFVVGRGPQAPPVPPTPTADEVAAQRQAQEDKMRELAQSLVQEMMAEKEADIRAELVARQTKIDELQRRLRASEKQAQEGRLNDEARQQREELERQIAAEEKARKQREAELAADLERANEAALQHASVMGATTAGEAGVAAGATPLAKDGQGRTEAAVPVAAAVVPTPPPPTATAPPTAAPAATATVRPEVTFNSFVEPSMVDSLPVIIKEAPVEWPLTAQRSRRQGFIIMQATVGADGTVVAVKTLRVDETGFGIPEAALAAARQYRFKPGTKDGVRITTFATITVPFRFFVQR